VVQVASWDIKTTPSNPGWHLRIVENGREIEAPCLPMLDCLSHFDHIDAANHFIHLAETHPRHQLPELLGDVDEKIDDLLRCPLISTRSACAFATPAATVPTPTSATSFTEMRALGFTFFRS